MLSSRPKVARALVLTFLLVVLGAFFLFLQVRSTKTDPSTRHPKDPGTSNPLTNVATPLLPRPSWEAIPAEILNRIRNNCAKDGFPDDMIADLISLQDLLAEPRTTQQAWQMLTAILMDPKEGLALRALAGVLLAGASPDQARRSFAQVLDGAPDRLACVCVYSFLLKHYDPKLPLEKRCYFWRGLFAQWWSNDLFCADYSSQATRRYDLSSADFLGGTSGHFVNPLTEFDARIDWVRLHTERAVRDTLVSYLRKGQTITARILILRNLNDEGDLGALALEQYQSRENNGLVRKVAIEQYRRSMDPNRSDILRGALETETDGVIRASISAILTSQATTPSDKEKVLQACRNVLATQQDDAVVTQHVLRNASILDTREAVDFLAGVVGSPAYNPTARSDALAALSVYPFKTPFLQDRWRVVIDCLNSDATNLQTMAAWLFVQRVERAQDAGLTADKLKELVPQLRAIATKSQNAELQKAVGAFAEKFGEK